MGQQGLSQVQKQAQSLVLAPQMRQSLKILQAPALELRNTILEELEINPTLEELSMDSMSLEAQSPESGDGASAESEAAQSEDLNFSDEDYSALSRMSEDYRDHFSQDNVNTPYTSEDAERRQHFFDSLVSETSLQEYLIRQAELLELSTQARAAIEYLIGCLDDRGFLTTSLSDAALMGNFPLEAVQEAASVLQSLDPPGIGSQDLQACLLNQLRQKGAGKSLAAAIIRDHFEALLRRRIPVLAKKTGSSVEAVEKALLCIAALDPAPGRRFSEDNNRVIDPDVTITKDGEQWVVHLNGDYIPRLRINSVYKQLMAGAEVRGKDREYLREQIRNGKFLIGAIEQRQNTVKRIAEEILKVQEPFFEHGVSRLLPLTMKVKSVSAGE